MLLRKTFLECRFNGRNAAYEVELRQSTSDPKVYEVQTGWGVIGGGVKTKLETFEGPAEWLNKSKAEVAFQARVDAKKARRYVVVKEVDGLGSGGASAVGVGVGSKAGNGAGGSGGAGAVRAGGKRRGGKASGGSVGAAAVGSMAQAGSVKLGVLAILMAAEVHEQRTAGGVDAMEGEVVYDDL